MACQHSSRGARMTTLQKAAKTRKKGKREEFPGKAMFQRANVRANVRAKVGQTWTWTEEHVSKSRRTDPRRWQIPPSQSYAAVRPVGSGRVSSKQSSQRRVCSRPLNMSTSTIDSAGTWAAPCCRYSAGVDFKNCKSIPSRRKSADE